MDNKRMEGVKMPEKKLGNKCLVDSCQIETERRDEYDEDGEIKKTNSLFVEMDGQHWDSKEYENLGEFLQSIIDHAHNVSMGKE